MTEAAALVEAGALIDERFSEGRCRELLAEYGPAARVAVPAGADFQVVALSDLLPHAYDAAARLGAARS